MWKGAGPKLDRKGGSLVLAHHVADGLLESVEGQLKHGKDLPDVTDGPGIGPFLGKNWIDPHRMGKGFDNEV